MKFTSFVDLVPTLMDVHRYDRVMIVSSLRDLLVAQIAMLEHWSQMVSQVSMALHCI